MQARALMGAKGSPAAARRPHGAIVVSFVVAAVALFLIHSTVAGAQAAAPRLLEVDLVSGNASSVPSANGWGAHGDRVVRTPGGDLYTTYVTTGRDADHFGWVLAKRRAGSLRWSTVASGATAHQPRNPPQVLLAGGVVYVIAISPWDSAAKGAPEIWDSTSRTTTVIPGHWLTDEDMLRAGALYPSAGVDATGNLYVWEDVPCPSFTSAGGQTVHCQSTNVPGTYLWAYRSAMDGTWHSRQVQSPARQTYNFLLARSPMELRVLGTRDIAQSEAPHTCRNGSGYCFDQTLLARWTAPDILPSSITIARAARDAPGYEGDHRASAEDAYVDSDGRTHVLVSLIDATTNGTWENHHLVIDPNGAVSDTQYQVPYSNTSRIVQDSRGRFWIFSVGPYLDGHHCAAFIAGSGPGDTSATSLGPLSVLSFGGSYDCSSVERNFAVAPRSGTSRADYLDGVVETNGGRDWVHYRISLPATSPPASTVPTIGERSSQTAADRVVAALASTVTRTVQVLLAPVAPITSSSSPDHALAGIPTVQSGTQPRALTINGQVADGGPGLIGALLRAFRRPAGTAAERDTGARGAPSALG